MYSQHKKTKNTNTFTTTFQVGWTYNEPSRTQENAITVLLQFAEYVHEKWQNTKMATKMKPSCTDCWKLILGRYNSFFSPHEESWIQTSLATSSCHGKTKQISAPDTCVYSVCVQCVCTVCVLLTTGMGSCSTLGCDSARSLVCLSQRAPSRNSPLMYTPECHAHNTETISGTEILASPEPSVPWLPCLLALPEPVKPLWTKLNAPLRSVTVFSERHVSCPINSLGGARFGDSWQSVTHTHTCTNTLWDLEPGSEL